MTNRLSTAGAPDGNQVLDSIALNDKEASSSPSRNPKIALPLGVHVHR
ncbi:hypothetical protein [Mesorhizobium muleiense]|nr:hypothetical protein [Mesorhizobium muleiense]MCF6100547.1 hypothetical protein [Mesorhizobium muleiense]